MATIKQSAVTRAQSPNQGGGAGTFQGPNGTAPSDTAGGTDQPLGTFSTTAYGPPWVGIQGTGVTADGTDLRPARKVYGVAVDPKVIPLGTYLHIWPNPFGWEGAFKAFDTGSAIKGRRIDFYDWRGRATQVKWGRQNATVHKAPTADSKLSKPATGGTGIHIPNPLNAVDDMASAVKDLIDFILSPKSIGDLLAKIAAYFLKLIFKAVWNYVIAPVLHWEQRAVLTYYRDTMAEKSGLGGFVTLSFWATGYAILWAKVDGDRSLVTEPGKTPLGSFLRSVGNSRARRRLVKPKDVEKKTPKKPTPVASTARIIQQGTMTANRRRTVRIGGTGSERLSSGDAGSDGRRVGDDVDAADTPRDSRD
jgi:3D (Asp-Asp-Asp) domain-containing protein